MATIDSRTATIDVKPTAKLPADFPPLTEETSSGASSVSDSSASYLSTSASSVESGTTWKAAENKVKDANTTYYPHPTSFKLSEHSIDEIRPISV